MPYHRFRLHKQWGRFNTRMFKVAHLLKNRHVMPEFVIPEPLVKRGVAIEDPNSADFPVKRTASVPVKITHPEFYVPKPEDHEHYKHTPCYLFDGTEVLSEGIDQALVLSKCLRRDGLPESVMDRVKGIQFPLDHQEMLRRQILHANKWDSALDQLPKRHNAMLFWLHYRYEFGTPDWRKNEILFDNLYRYCMTFTGQYPSLLELRHFRYGSFNATTRRHGDEILCFRHNSLSTVLTRQPLTPVQTGFEVEASRQEPLTDIYPIKPIIDLPENHIYEHRPQFPFSWKTEPLNYHVHTVFCSRQEDSMMAQKYPWTASEKAGSAILKCFGSALAVAKRKFGDDCPKVLPEPVVVQLIQLCHGALDFVVFQLNTLDYSDSDGVRNTVWLDAGNQFFVPKMFYENFEEVEELNADVFTKFLALMLNR